MLSTCYVSFYSSPYDYLFTIASSVFTTDFSFFFSFFLGFVFFYLLSCGTTLCDQQTAGFWKKTRHGPNMLFSFNTVTHFLSSHRMHVLSWNASCHLLDRLIFFVPSYEVERNRCELCLRMVKNCSKFLIRGLFKNCVLDMTSADTTLQAVKVVVLCRAKYLCYLHAVCLSA